MKLHGSHTEKNLIKAIQGEAMAHIKYMVYASLIGKTSKQIEKQINEISHNEKEHWKIYAKLLLDDDYYDDKKNFLNAILGESKECHTLYPEFARVARAEGFSEIADKFNEISKIECNHQQMFEDLLSNYEQTNEDVCDWKCDNCGYIYNGVNSPEKCPVCNHPKNYFYRL